MSTRWLVADQCLHVADLTPLSVEDSLDQKNLRGIKDKRKRLCVQTQCSLTAPHTDICIICELYKGCLYRPALPQHRLW